MAHQAPIGLSRLDKDFLDRLKRIRGRPIGNGGNSEFYICEICGQAVDGWSLYQALHHEQNEHKRLTEAELSELG